MLKSFEVQSGRLVTLFICGSKETNRSIEIKMTWIYHQMQLKLNYSQGSLRRSNQCLQKIWRLISRALLKNNRMPCKESLSVQKLFQMKLKKSYLDQATKIRKQVGEQKALAIYLRAKQKCKQSRLSGQWGKRLVQLISSLTLMSSLGKVRKLHQL